jgi:hypothetical protein
LTSSLRRLNASVEANNLQLHILGLGQPWKGHGMKISLLQEFLGISEIAGGCEDVLFLDAYDVLMLQAPAGLLQARFRSLGGGIVFNGEVACAPDPSLHTVWPANDLGSPLPFLNSGVFVGKAAVVRAMLRDVTEDLASNFGVAAGSPAFFQADDQRLYSRWFLQHTHLARVDSAGLLFHSLHGFDAESFAVLPVGAAGAFVWSHATRTSPLVIHGNGNGCSALLSITGQLEQVDWPPLRLMGPDPPRPVHTSEWEGCNWPYNSF